MLIQPGNPRYQPKATEPFFGYDNLTRPQVRVELALLDTLHDVGKIPATPYSLLTPPLRNEILGITTSMVDEQEKGRDALATTHDLLVNVMRAVLPDEFKRTAGLVDSFANPSIIDPTNWFNIAVEAIGQNVVNPQAIVAQLQGALPLFSEEVGRRTRAITGTRHDIRALVRLIQRILPEPLRPYVHTGGATSYDIILTAAVLNFKDGFYTATEPTLNKLIEVLATKAEEFKNVGQIGRTHGQHAVPITVGFWLATLLARLLFCRDFLRTSVKGLRGKFSGPVGAYNAQTLFGLTTDKINFEELVLEKVNLKPGSISTQILLPEPITTFLYGYVLLSGALAQVGRDCRHLQRSEIQEIMEYFGEGMVGSSTMAGKRNPARFEQVDGFLQNIIAEFLKVLQTLVSEHQRDLTGSSLMREFPGIVVLVQQQIETLTRTVERMTVDFDALERNLGMNPHIIMGELMYLALQEAGFPGDGHEFVNHTLVPQSSREKGLLAVCEEMAQESTEIRETLARISDEVKEALRNPSSYVGLAVQKTEEIVALARAA